MNTWLIRPAFLGSRMNRVPRAVIDAGIAAGTIRRVFGNWFRTVHVPVADRVPRNIIPPLISGTAQVGQVLTSGAGVWDPEPDSYVYEWYSGDVALGHDSDQYTPVVGDIGNQITSEVVATNINGDSVAVRGNSVGPVIAAADDEPEPEDDEPEVDPQQANKSGSYDTKVMTPE